MSLFVRLPGKFTRYSEIPDEAKAPLGPYQQAPDGSWWLISPFTGPEPWVNAIPAPQVALPEGFDGVFGPKPRQQDYANSTFFRRALDYWEQNLANFKRAGLGDIVVSPQKLNEAQNLCVQWGLGNARFYEGLYGFVARFPDCEIYDFDCWARDVIEDPHHIIAVYQGALLARGIVPDKKHPLVPPQLWPEE